MTVYEIVKETGCGVMESPLEYHFTGIIYANKKMAELYANFRWLRETTEEDRKSGWCGLHYTVKPIEVIDYE